MSVKLESLSARLKDAFGEDFLSVVLDRQELTIVVPSCRYAAIAQQLRDDAAFGFEQLIDLSGLDYSGWKNGAAAPANQYFAVSCHLLSLQHNYRLRLRTFAEDNEFPVVDSLINIWPSVNWYEREAFDLFGIMFNGHPDLRRILTDYGFVGYPFRKDFPVSGHVEMRYDPAQGRVVYQPVSIAPREVTPRIVREAAYGGLIDG